MVAAETDMTGTEEATGTPRPWRKRHPVLSRSVLYVLGAGLVALLVLLFVDRRAQDESDRIAALREELNALNVVHVVDPDGDLVLKVLDEKFSEPGLPVRLQGRILRWRAMAQRKRGDREAVEAALREAAALDLEPLERAALQVEWAEARAEAGDGRGALEVLPAAAPSHPLPLALLRAYVQAYARSAAGDRPQAIEGLRAALAGLSVPLPRGPEAYVGGRSWSPAQAATVVSELVGRLAGPGAAEPGALWNRLRALAPEDYEAQVAAARGLAAAGREPDARSAWARARALDGRQAATQAASDPALAALGRDAP
jgi:hypothetical protein